MSNPIHSGWLGCDENDVSHRIYFATQNISEANIDFSTQPQLPPCLGGVLNRWVYTPPT